MAATSGNEERIRAVFFDFDGVILESADVKTDAFVELFSHLPPEQVEAVRRHHTENMGISRYKKFEWIYSTLLERELSQQERDDLGRRFSEIVFQRVLKSPFVPGARQALAALDESHLLFVVSGTPEDELVQIVEKRGLRQHFREVCGSPREKPDIVRRLLIEYRLDPEQGLFIGDGSSDYRAAVETNVEFLARDTPALHDSWVQEGVKMAADLRELEPLIRSWR